MGSEHVQTKLFNTNIIFAFQNCCPNSSSQLYDENRVINPPKLSTLSKYAPIIFIPSLAISSLVTWLNWLRDTDFSWGKTWKTSSSITWRLFLYARPSVFVSQCMYIQIGYYSPMRWNYWFCLTKNPSKTCHLLKYP